MSVEPIVDELKQEFEGELIVLKVNVQEEVGQEIGAQYGFEFTPSFLFFNAEGEIIYKSIGMLDPQQVRSTLRQP